MESKGVRVEGLNHRNLSIFFSFLYLGLQVPLYCKLIPLEKHFPLIRLCFHIAMKHFNVFGNA